MIGDNRKTRAVVKGCGGLLTLGVALAASGLAAAAMPAPTGLWQAKGNQFHGTFQVTSNSRYVTALHGTALAGARKGCPVVHPGEPVLLPAKIPITHVLPADEYVVESTSKIAQLPLHTPVIAGGTRHADGAIEMFWELQANGQPIVQVDVTWGQLAQGCHISFYAVGA